MQHVCLRSGWELDQSARPLWRTQRQSTSPQQPQHIHSLESKRNKQVSGAWKQHIYQLAFPSHKLWSQANCVGDTGWGQVGFKAVTKLKGLGLGQQEQVGLHSLTWWGFWSALPPRGSLSNCVSFSSVFLKSAGGKVTPSRSQRVRRRNGGWAAAFASVQTLVSFFLYGKKKNKAIGPVPGHLKKFWWYTPRIPGNSRIFQSYAIWDLGTPGSQEERVRMTPSPGARNKGEKGQKCAMNTVGNDGSKERFPIQSTCIFCLNQEIWALNKCLSEEANQSSNNTIKTWRLISCF